jgi:hypothetical protein
LAGTLPATGQSAGNAQAQAQSQFSNQTKYHIIEMLKLADDKAKVVFGLCAALLVYLFNRDDSIPRTALTVLGCVGLDKVLLSLQAVGAIGLLLSSTFALFVIVPRTATSYRGLIFFGSIVAWPSNVEYAEQVMNRSPYSLEMENAKHNYDMSLVIAKKYRALRRCILSMGVGLGFLLTAFGIEKTVALAELLR